MKKVFLGIIAIVIALVLFLVIRTYTYPFAKNNNATSDVSSVGDTYPSEKSVMRFVGGLRIATISNPVYEDTNFKPFNEFKAYLEKEYPRIYSTMDTVTVNGHGLLFHWKGKNPQAKPILLLSHYDVVPISGYDNDSISQNQGDIVFDMTRVKAAPLDSIQTQWQYSPFSATVKDGRIYGRGTLDMKCMLFSILEGADTLIAQNFQPEQDIWFAFGHDEEVSGRQGALKIAEYFKEKGITFDAVYDEGGVIVTPQSVLESIDKPIALVGTGEKGFLTLKIKVKGLGGHSSMPPAKGSLVYVAEIIEKLNSEQMPAEIISPIETFLDNIGSEMNFTSRLAIANQWLLKPLLIKSLAKSPASNALIRTTTAITMAKGSEAPNVLSSVSELTVNFRILPGNTVAQVMDHVNNICKGYDVEIETISSREPSSVSPIDTKGFNKIQELVKQLYPEAIVSSYITVGGTDAYKYQIVSDNIYRFMPLYLNQYEQRTIHNENETITIENFGKMIWYFKELMKTY